MSRILIGSGWFLEQVWVGVEESPDHKCCDRGKDHSGPCRNICAVAGAMQKLKKACHQDECKPSGSGSGGWQIPALFATPHTPKHHSRQVGWIAGRTSGIRRGAESW